MLRIEWEINYSGRTMSWLGRALGVTGAHIGRMLRGQRRWSELQKLKAAQALRWTKPVEELFQEVEVCEECEGLGVERRDGSRGGASAVLWVCKVCEGSGVVSLRTAPAVQAEAVETRET